MTSAAQRLPILGDRPTIGTKSASAALIGLPGTGSPNSPRTPLLGRSISSQFGSPSAYRSEQEEILVYELGSRHLSAGFAGESRPRCIYEFGPDKSRRVGDYRAYGDTHRPKRRKLEDEESFGEDFELYRSDLRSLDLQLVEDRLERAVRCIHVDHLQLDQKSRKAILVVPSLLPTPLVEIAVKVLLNHSAQLGSLTLAPSPVLACVSAGVRNGLVVDIGWEEAVVTAVGEYKEVFGRRSVRAGKLLTSEMARLLQTQLASQKGASENEDAAVVSFQYAEEVTKRMAWCQLHAQSHAATTMTKLPLEDAEYASLSHIDIPFQRLSEPAETTFFPVEKGVADDDHNLPVVPLIYQVLLALPVDLRAVCVSRIILTGGVAAIPGLKQRVLEELSKIIDVRGWDPVHNYGHATEHQDRILQTRSANIARYRQQKEVEPPLSPTKKPLQEDVPHMERIHDDKYDAFTQKAEREANRGKTEVFKGVVRRVESLGAWAGASLMASLRVKGVHEIERDDFLKHGLKDEGTLR